jgi:hypothetical protein
MNKMSIENYTTAAFISAGMHRDVEKLDKAKEGLGTGCFEFVQTAMNYVGHIQELYLAGLAVVGSVPGVFDYEVAEDFGVWYVNATLEDRQLPDVDWACDELYRLAVQFWAREDQGDLHQKVADALALVKQPSQPEI